ncbi:hypothetical protein NDA01_28065 [Trichocoleus desertorum AS-A10]|uniref:hypothetical protein n=1 Tax=Trichocoleus desertorum TaxID=1481672 RepID=UPI00329A5F01
MTKDPTGSPDQAMSDPNAPSSKDPTGSPDQAMSDPNAPSSTTASPSTEPPGSHESHDFDLSTEVDEVELQRLLSLFAERRRSDYARMANLSARLEEGDRHRDWDERDAAELGALITQYETLREESLQTLNNRTQITLLGLTAIAALVAGSLTIEKPEESRTIIYAVFSGAIPLICIFILLSWAGEAMRAHRVGYFLAADVEARINKKLGRFVMNWETALWTGQLPRDEMFGPSMVSFFVIGILSVAAPWFGINLIGIKNTAVIEQVLAVLIPYSFLAATALYLVKNMDRLRNIPVIQSVFLRYRK